MTIYVITNRITGKSYVGQSVDVVKRVRQHVRSAGTSRSLIARAISKYGVDAFYVRTVDLPENSSRDALNDAEVRVIEEMNTVHPYGYNLCSGGGVGAQAHPDSREKIRQSKLGKPRSPETVAKVRAALLANHPLRGVPFPEDRKRYLSELFKGQAMSEEQKVKLRAAWARRKAEGRGSHETTPDQRARMSAARKGWVPSQEIRGKISATLKGRKLSDETRAKMSATRKGRPHSEAHRLALCGRRCSEATKAKIAAKKRERDALARTAQLVGR